MRREIIEDFLNVPGIVGVAMMDGLSSPYFRGFDLKQQATFEPAQQVTVAQSIQQVLETTPEGFNSFEFQFDCHRVYLHKLKQGITLLVLTGNQVSRQTYTQAVRRLLIELQIDQADPIAEFRAMALAIPLPTALPLLPIEPLLPTELLPANSLPNPTIQPANALSLHPTTQLPGSENLVELPRQEPRLTAESAAEQPAGLSAQIYQMPDLLVEQLAKPSTSKPLSAQPRPAQEAQEIDLKDILAAINHLSQLTTQYLGTMIVSNYWNATRPPVDWLNHFQVERSAQMTFSVQMPSERLPMLTSEQHEYLQAWVLAFLERCSKVIRDFTKIVRQTLTEPQLSLLFAFA